MTKIRKDDEARFNEILKRDDEHEKGDEVLRRLLKTPPDPKTGKGEKPKKEDDNEAPKG